MNWTQISLNTLMTQLPKITNDNNNAFKNYMDVFYNETSGIIIKPITTTGRIKGASGEFVNLVADNFTVRNQYTNIYENITTADYDFYTTYIAGDVSTRVADASTVENQSFSYVDVNKPYYKISNDSSIAFLTTNLSQELRIIFDTSVLIASGDYRVLMDPSTNGGIEVMDVSVLDASVGAWVKIICVEYDASWGSTWAIKEFAGSYAITSI